MTRREEVTEFIVHHIGSIIPGDTHNPTLIRERLTALTDEQFEALMRRLLPAPTPEARAEQEVLPFYAPNLGEAKITLEQNLKVAEALGHRFFERIWLTDPQTKFTYLTPNEYLVVDLTVRRQAQMLSKKSSIPEDARHVDELSEQVTGDSKGSKISFPEFQAQLSQGLENTLLEEIKFRGGDRAAQQELERQILETGQADLDDLASAGTMTKSTETLSILLKAGMMLDNNLDEQ